MTHSDQLRAAVDSDKFWSKVDVSSAASCWPWKGYTSQGYGRYARTGAHRYAYQLIRGPIPAGLVCDHLCRNRACCNPYHIDIVDNKTNVLRGEGYTAKKARQTHCQRGHPLFGENLRMDRRFRVCRICIRANNLAYKARKRARLKAQKELAND